MDDYIKRSKAIQQIKDFQCRQCEDGIDDRCGSCSVHFALKLFEKLPAADARENVCGYWLHTDAVPHRVYCSVCFATYLCNEKMAEWIPLKLHPNYCPNCGAKMREVKTHDNN